MIRAIIASTIVLGFAGFLAALSYRASASVRHAIWFIGLVSALGIGALAAIGPVVDVESSALAAAETEAASGDWAINGASDVSSGQRARTTGEMAGERPIADSRLPIPHSRFPIPDSRFPVAVWLLGVTVVVGRALMAHVAARRVIGRSEHLDADLRLGVDASIDVRLSADVDGPFTLGVLRPVILLPLDAPYWSRERLRIVLVHEAAHVARLDYVAQLLGTAACAAYWFNPIVWLAASRLRAEAEHAADDRVLAAGVDGVTYASHLLELARPESAPLSTALAVGMARGTNRLEKRFTAMLDSRRSRGIVPLRLQAALGSAAMLAALPMTSIRLVPAAPKAAPQVVTAPVPLAVVAPAVLATTGAPAKSAVRAKAPITRALASVAAQQADTVFEQSLSASPGETLNITIRDGGTVTIHSGQEGKVRVRGVLSGTLARETRAAMDKYGNSIEFRTIVPEYRGSSRNSNAFEFWVPSRFNVNVSSGGGAITIVGIEGRFTGSTGGGEITLESVTGRVDLSTGGGEVSVRNSNLEGTVSTGGGQAIVTNTQGGVTVSSGSGPVIRDGTSRGQTRVYGVGGLSPQTTIGYGQTATVIDGKVTSISSGTSYSLAGGSIRLESLPGGGSFTTGGGEIVIGSVGGTATFTTGGGDITLGNVADDVSASTGAGDVQISVIDAGGRARNISVASGSGRVVIELPAGIDARLDLETAYTERHGPTRIQSDFPVNVSETSEWDARNGTPRRYVRASGDLGAGRGLIKVRTVNGDVIIRRK